MTTDTSKIVNAANDLSSGLTKGGTAAKTLGQEIANAILSLDSRVTALETAPPVQPPVDTNTAGAVTDFNPAPGSRFKVGGKEYGVHNAGKSYSLTNPDTYTLRFEAHPGEYGQSDGSYCERSAITCAVNNAANEVIDVAYAFKIDSPFNNVADWFLTSQMHNDDWATGYGTGTSPPFAMEFVGNKLSVVGRHCPTGQNPDNASGNVQSLRLWTDPKAFRTDVWHNFKAQMKFSNNAQGFLKVWVDDAQVVNYSGPLGYGYGVAWEYGVYRAASTGNVVIAYRNMSLVP